MFFVRTNKNNIRILNKLVLNNCFILGQTSKLTNKNFTRCLLGTRHTLEIFKLYEIRHLLLKTYSLIYSLFFKERSLYKRMLWRRYPRVIKKRKLEEYQKVNPNWDGRVRFYPFRVRKNIPAKILFASVTPQYADIIEEAAMRCQMPWQTGEWLNGSVTALVSPLKNKIQWNFYSDDKQWQMEKNFRNMFGGNKEDIEYTQEKKNIYNTSYTPALILIPDVKNNFKIIEETKKMDVPILGLVSTDCQLNIDYPILAQDMSIPIVHFFCHFMATLITKEMSKLQHKLFTKTKSGLVRKDHNFFSKTIPSRFWFFYRDINQKFNGKKKAKIFRLQEHFLHAKWRRKHLMKENLLLSWNDRFAGIKKVEQEEFMNFEKFYYFFYQDSSLDDYSREEGEGKEIDWRNCFTNFTKNCFLRDKKYLLLLFEVFRNSYISKQTYTFNLTRTPEIIINSQRVKKKILFNKNIYWTNYEQKRALIKAKKNPASFANILRHQWNRKQGRLRYNNANKMYYWTPLWILVQTSYFKRLKKKFYHFRQNIVHTDYVRKYAYQKYKTMWFRKTKKKLLAIVKRKRALAYFFNSVRYKNKKSDTLKKLTHTKHIKKRSSI